MENEENRGSKKKIAFVTDFDGTITKEDFFNLAVKRYFAGDNRCGLQPWQDFLDGKITHFQALNKIFNQVRDTKESFDALVDKIVIDDAFLKTVDLCRDAAIPMYILSAGCDYYINRVIGSVIKANDIHLITNKGVLTKEEGLRMIAPDEGSKYFHHDTGVSKAAVVQDLKEQGYFVIFAGDGLPDFAPAELADVVFAKSMLLDKCKQTGLKTEKFNDYNDIYDYIKRLIQDNALPA